MLPTLQLEEELLPILTVAEGCSEEFPDTTRLVWLVSMARAIYSEPPQLILRPDESWNWIEHQKTRKVISPGIKGRPLYETETQAKHRRMFERMGNPTPPPKVTKYDKNLSYLKKLTEIKSTKEPFWISQPGTFKEKIYRDDFRAWCLTSGYNLPRFWFESETAPQQSIQEKREAEDRDLRKQVEEFAATERKKGTPMHKIIWQIEDKYIFKGQVLHDIIWPEHIDRTPGNKNTALSRNRKKSEK